MMASHSKALAAVGAAPTIGFAAPVHDAQAVFRAVLDCLARPGTVQPVPALPAGAPFQATAAAVLLTLADHETTVWLDAPLAAQPEVAAYVRFTTGAKIVDDPAAATFAVVSAPVAMPPLAAFAQGSPEYPDRSTTLIVIVDRIDAAPTSEALALSGPGIRGRAHLAFAPRPADLADQLVANRDQFPRGVDLIVCGPGIVAGLPRSTRIGEA
jgi:alpha-D-ribose 1-methylphosphonate 5-triphosphate synthase subunit PhnH